MISFVIPAHNESRLLAATLQALQEAACVSIREHGGLQLDRPTGRQGRQKGGLQGARNHPEQALR